MSRKEERVYEFDFVHDTQKVFRSLMKAMANPGTAEDIGEQSAKFGERAEVCGALAAVGCTLLDSEELVYVEKNPALASELHDLTLCRSGSLEDADYVFLSSELNYGSLEQILRNVKKGTYKDPQDSATVVIFCRDIEGDIPMTISGPGVKGDPEISVTQYLKTIVQLRQSLETEYPLGTDLIFATRKGKIMCFPRLCRVREQ